MIQTKRVIVQVGAYFIFNLESDVTSELCDFCLYLVDSKNSGAPTCIFRVVCKSVPFQKMGLGILFRALVKAVV